MRVTVKHLGTLGGYAALAVCVLFVTNSAAERGKEGQSRAGAVARTSNASPLFGITIPLGYRDWRLISVAHEEGSLNDLRAILGNDVAIKAYREGDVYTRVSINRPWRNRSETVDLVISPEQIR